MKVAIVAISISVSKTLVIKTSFQSFQNLLKFNKIGFQNLS
jgi:hypothetical protein